MNAFRIFSKNWFRGSLSKAFLLVLIAVVASVAAVHAYFRFLSPQVGPRVSITSLPLEFSMELDKTEYQQGENVTIRLALKNVGNKAITLRWPSFTGFYGAILLFDLYVLDVNSTNVFQWSHVHVWAESVHEETLTPDEKLLNVFVWDQWTYPEGQAPMFTYPQGPVPKGVYSVRGLTRQFRLTVGDQSSVITLETPTITFTIE